MSRRSPSIASRIGLAALLLAGLGAGSYWWMKNREPATEGGVSVTRRITQEQYRNIVADVFGPNVDVGGRFEIDVRDSGLMAVGTGRVSITAAGFEQYDKMARSIATCGSKWRIDSRRASCGRWCVRRRSNWASTSAASISW